MQHDPLFTGDLLTPLIILLLTPRLAGARRTGTPVEGALLPAQQQLNVDIVRMQLRRLLLRYLRGQLHDIHKDIVAVQRIAPRRLIRRRLASPPRHGTTPRVTVDAVRPHSAPVHRPAASSLSLRQPCHAQQSRIVAIIRRP